MKKTVLWTLVFVLAFSLCACHVHTADLDLGTEPTEYLPPAMQIIAPVDIYAGNPPENRRIDLTIQEGYKLIQDMDSDDYPYKRHYEYLSNSNFCICIRPMLLESDLENFTMSYTIRTNYSGLFNSNFKYLGKEEVVDKAVLWCGILQVPEVFRDLSKPDHIWVDILIKADDKVVGFAVVEIVDWHTDCYLKDHGGCYTVADRYSEYYPLVDGQLQDIDLKFVLQRIEQYHKFAE